MAIDKSIRADYAIQGGGPNYLGKQKMVKAPKKWQSSPDHEPAELAYITEKEKDILIDLDLYGSLNGKPNRGPSGIISLQGDMGSIGGGRSSSGGGGGGDRQDRARQSAAAERAMQATIAQAESNQREADRSNQLAEARKLMTQPTAVANPLARTPIPLGTVDPYQQSYVYPDKIWTDPRSVYETGDYNEIIQGPKKDTGAVDVGFQEALRKQQIATDLRQKQQDPNFGQFFRPQPVVEQPSGIMGTVKEKSTDYAKKMVRNKIMKELGLSTLNPFLGVGSWLLDKFAPGKKAALKSNITNLLTSKSDDLVGTPDWQGEQKRKKTFHEGKGDGDKQQVTTVQEAVAGKGLAEGQKMLGIDEIKKRHSLLQTTLNDGYYVDNKGRNIQLNDQQKAMLTDYISQIDKYLVNIDTRTMSAHGGRIDKALGGRVRDI